MIVLIAVGALSLFGIGGTIRAIRNDGYRAAVVDGLRATSKQ